MRRVTLRSAILWTLLTLLVFLLVEGALFRSGWYSQFLQPNSSTGLVENNLLWLRRTPSSGKREILVFGDSRVAEGFSAPTAEAASGNQLTFWNFGIPGMSIRNWYFLLRDADPGHHRFGAVVLAMQRYTDEDSFDNPPDRIVDLSYSLGRLRLSDCPDFAMSMKSADHRQTALSGCLFKGLTLRADIHQFLLAPSARIKEAADIRKNGLFYQSGYTGVERDLKGLVINSAHQVVAFPPGLPPDIQFSIQNSVRPAWAPDSGDNTRYRQRWLGRIVDFYRDTSTRVIFIEMPRGPFSPSEGTTPARYLDSVRGKPGISIIPAETFREFEKPEFFADGLHLNSTGRKLFSARLSNAVAGALEAH